MNAARLATETPAAVPITERRVRSDASKREGIERSPCAGGGHTSSDPILSSESPHADVRASHILIRSFRKKGGVRAA